MPEAKGMKKYLTDNSAKFDTVQLRSELHVDYVLAKRFTKTMFQNNSVLANASILKQPIGTNFKLSKEEADEIERVMHAKSMQDPKSYSRPEDIGIQSWVCTFTYVKICHLWKLWT
jgi:hypothetical protein